MYILSNKRLLLSSRLIQSKLQEAGISLELRTEPGKYAPAVRWGISSGVYHDEDTRLNEPLHIRVCGNKERLSTLLKQRGLPHVEINRGTPERFPVIVRTELARGGGIGIVIVLDLDEFGPFKKYAWSYWEEFQSEFGIHMLGGKVVKVFRKVWDGGGDEPEFPIRNTQNGYRFSRINFGDKTRMMEYCASVYEALPIQMCRLDVGWVNGVGYKLLEINSAPDLSQNSNTLQMYVDYLEGQLRGKE